MNGELRSFVGNSTTNEKLYKEMSGLNYQNERNRHFATKAIHVGQSAEQWKSMAVIPPIVMATTYKQKSPGVPHEYEYSRSGNPTRKCLESCIASLENGNYGLCFASGMAATTTLSMMLRSGDHVICSDDVYGGTSRFFRKVISNMSVECTFVDATNVDNVEKAIKNNTRMCWLETPTNPLMMLSDIAAIGHVLKEHGNIICIVDNTFMTPYFQQPLTLGADIVVHSLTKYMNGHSDVVMGAIVTNRDDLYESLKFLQNAMGAIPSPLDCYLVNRGIKTLHLRMREHMRSGLIIAKFLENHPCIEKVLHPGLTSHPQHKLACQQMSGFSGMISFYIRGGAKEAEVFLRNLKIFTLAESLGGYESLAEQPSVMTHASIPQDHREKLGISDSLLRLSVGLECVEDLVEDVDQALRAAVEKSTKAFR